MKYLKALLLKTESICLSTQFSTLFRNGTIKKHNAIITGDCYVNTCSNIFITQSTDIIDNLACSGYVSVKKKNQENHSLANFLKHLCIISEIFSDLDAVFCSIPQIKPVTRTLQRIRFKECSDVLWNSFKFKVAEELKLFHTYVDFSIDDIFHIVYRFLFKIKEKKHISKKIYSSMDDSRPS